LNAEGGGQTFAGLGNRAAQGKRAEGELGELQAMWREAEQIAEIADRLPDALDEEVR
jgi:hypothetical protein